MTTDPIADLLTRVRNATLVRHDTVMVPFSNLKLALSKVLKEEGFVRDVEIVRGQPQRVLKITLAYAGKKEPMIKGIKRMSKPGLRVYVGKDEIPRVYGRLGVAILSTPKGVLTGQQARQQGTGGEVLCVVW